MGGTHLHLLKTRGCKTAKETITTVTQELHRLGSGLREDESSTKGKETLFWETRIGVGAARVRKEKETPAVNALTISHRVGFKGLPSTVRNH